MLTLAAVVDLPHQRRPAVQVLGDLGEPVLVGVHAGDDLVADLPHRCVVEGQQARADFLLAAGPVVHARADERDVAADVLLQQPLRVEQVELVVLFEDAEPRWLAERAEVHRRRVHRRRDVEKAQVDDAAGQRHLPHVAHQRDVGVVDGDRQLGLVLDRRGDDVFVGGRDGLHRRRCAARGQQAQHGNAPEPAPVARRQNGNENRMSLLRGAGCGAFMGRTEEAGNLARTMDDGRLQDCRLTDDYGIGCPGGAAVGRAEALAAFDGDDGGQGAVGGDRAEPPHWRTGSRWTSQRSRRRAAQYRAVGRAEPAGAARRARRRRERRPAAIDNTTRQVVAAVLRQLDSVAGRAIGLLRRRRRDKRCRRGLGHQHVGLAPPAGRAAAALPLSPGRPLWRHCRLHAARLRRGLARRACRRPATVVRAAAAPARARGRRGAATGAAALAAFCRAESRRSSGVN